MKNESAFTRRFTQLLERVDYTSLVISGGTMAGTLPSMQRPGMPDRYIFGPGVPGVWCEIKKDNGKLSVHQHRLIREMVNANVPVVVITYRVTGFRAPFVEVQHPVADSESVFRVFLPAGDWVYWKDTALNCRDIIRLAWKP